MIMERHGLERNAVIWLRFQLYDVCNRWKELWQPHIRWHQQPDKTANKSNDEGGRFFLLTNQHHVVAPLIISGNIFICFYIILHTVLQFYADGCDKAKQGPCSPLKPSCDLSWMQAHSYRANLIFRVYTFFT